MSRRLALVLAAALLTAGIAVFSGAAPAFADDAASLLSPDDASALIAGPAVSGTSATTAVAPSTALAASSLPNSVTSVESDLTLDQAVGLDPTSTTTAALRSSSSTGTGTGTGINSLALASVKPMCWANAYWGRWGIWPYEQRITDTTYWCAIYGSKITYRTSSVTGGGTLCGMNWRASQLIGGGVGLPSFTMRSSAGFSCPTVIPWIVLHPSHHLDVRRDSRGGTVLVGSG
ncbi:MAG: hypothetical protein ACRDLM_01565 [Gaiellaceae bacterium]